MAGTESADTARRPARSARVTILLIAMTALAPVSLQIFLPALPAIQGTFGTSTGVTQLVLSLSILANAIATLIYGPLSDRFGRRPVVLAGIAGSIIGSLWCVFADSIGALILARILQSAGAAAGMVLARAIVRDLYNREEAASAIAYLTMAMVVAPMVAPTFGALLIDHFGWRTIFVALTAIGIALGVLVFRDLAETRPGRSGHGAPMSIMMGAGHLLKEPAFLAYVLQSSFAISTFFAFISGAPYFLIDVLGHSATTYGLCFMVVSGGFMAGNFASARLSGRVGIDPLIQHGSLGSLVATLVAFGLLAAGNWTILALFGPMLFAAFANGLTIANAQAGAVSVDPALAGTASGLAGFGQMFIAALVSQAVGMFQNGTPYPMAAFMAACAILSWASFMLLRRQATTAV